MYMALHNYITLHVFYFQDEDIPGNYNLFNMEEKSDGNGEVIFASIYYHNGWVIQYYYIISVVRVDSE